MTTAPAAIPRWIHGVGTPCPIFSQQQLARETTNALDRNRKQLVQKIVRAADIAVTGINDRCLLSPQELSKGKGNDGEVLWAGESADTDQCVNGYCRRRALCCRASKVCSSCSLARQHWSFSSWRR